MKIPAWVNNLMHGCVALTLCCYASSVIAQDHPPTTAPFDYSRLAHPDVADRLQLTDEQRAAVSRLLDERAQALAKLGGQEQQKYLAKNDQALGELLTPEQRKVLSTANVPQKLHFSFRSQGWLDVLDWFAKQAGLALIMDEAPSGEFTYSDAKEYTPSEAIDLLNSVLLTKGYTLSRRERMLLLIKLGESIPYDLIEQIPPDQIDRFGKFELVTVVFPIGNRPADAIKAEVEPLLGTYGRCVALPTSKQVHITDTAGKMHAIGSLIGSVPEPSPPQPPAPPAPPAPSPRFAVFPYRQIDGDVAVETLKKLVPQATFAVDKRGKQISAYGLPAQLEAIQAALAQMTADLPAATAAYLKAHPIRTASAANLAARLKLVAPDAKIEIDESQKRLLVFGSPEEHEAIQRALVTLDHSAPNQETPAVLVVYRTAEVDSQTAATLLEDLFPTAKITHDPKSQRLLVWASLTEHAQIRGMLEQFGSDAPPAATEKQLVAYDAPGHDMDALVPMLTHLVPEMQLSADKQAEKIIAWGTSSDQQLLAQAMDQVHSGTAAKHRTMKIYPTGQSDPVQLRNILIQVTPLAVLIVDAKARTIVAWASDDDHASLTRAVEQFAVTEPVDVSAKLYQVDPFPSDVILEALDPRLVDQIVVKKMGNHLWIRATAPEHQQLAAAIEDVKSELPKEMAQTQAVAQVYAFQHAEPASAKAILAQLIPTATFVVDAKARALAATASAADQVRIRDLILDLDRDATSDERRVSAVYPVQHGNAASIASAVKQLYRQSAATAAHASDDGRQLVVVAPQRDQDAIQQIVQQLDVMQEQQLAGTIQVFALDDIDGPTAVDALQNVFADQVPEVRIRFVQQANQLLAMATEAQQEQIRAALEKLRPSPREFEVYQLATMDPYTAQDAIDELYGDLDEKTAPTTDADPESRRLIVRGTADQLSQIRDLLVKLGESGLSAESDRSKFRVVPFSGNAAKTLEQLQQLWPGIRGNELRIVEPAGAEQNRPSDADATFVPPQDTSAVVETGPQKRAVPVDPVGFQTGSAGAQQAGQPAENTQKAEQRKAPIVVIPGADRITITSDDVEALDQFESLLQSLSQLDTTSIGAGDYAIFPLRNASAGQMQAVLDSLFRRGATSPGSFGGDVVFVADERLNALIVHGSRRDRETVERLVQILDAADAPNPLVMTQPRIIQLQHTDATRVRKILESVYKAQLTSGGGRRQVSIPKGVPPEVATVLQQINAAAAGPILTLETDTVTNSIVVMAPTQLSSEIERLVQQLDTESLSANRRVTSIIRLKEASSAEMRKMLDELLKSR